MKNQCSMQVVLILTLAVLTITSGLVTTQQCGYIQENLSPVMNQTSNQTGNQSLSPAIPGKQGDTPPTS